MADTIILQKWQRAPRCEYTAPGSETEAIDCWEEATRRHVRPTIEELEDQENPGTFVATYVERTAGMYCEKHSDPSLTDGDVVEEVDYIRAEDTTETGA